MPPSVAQPPPPHSRSRSRSNSAPARPKLLSSSSQKHHSRLSLSPIPTPPGSPSRLPTPDPPQKHVSYADASPPTRPPRNPLRFGYGRVSWERLPGIATPSTSGSASDAETSATPRPNSTTSRFLRTSSFSLTSTKHPKPSLVQPPTPRLRSTSSSSSLFHIPASSRKLTKSNPLRPNTSSGASPTRSRFPTSSHHPPDPVAGRPSTSPGSRPSSGIYVLPVQLSDHKPRLAPSPAEEKHGDKHGDELSSAAATLRQNTLLKRSSTPASGSTIRDSRSSADLRRDSKIRYSWNRPPSPPAKDNTSKPVKKSFTTFARDLGLSANLDRHLPAAPENSRTLKKSLTTSTSGPSASLDRLPIGNASEPPSPPPPPRPKETTRPRKKSFTTIARDLGLGPSSNLDRAPAATTTATTNIPPPPKPQYSRFGGRGAHRIKDSWLESNNQDQNGLYDPTKNHSGFTMNRYRSLSDLRSSAIPLPRASPPPPTASPAQTSFHHALAHRATPSPAAQNTLAKFEVLTPTIPISQLLPPPPPPPPPQHFTRKRNAPPSTPPSASPPKALPRKRTDTSFLLKPPPGNTGLQFSTADRTILEELKRNIKAKESQFVAKGPYATRDGEWSGGWGLGKIVGRGGGRHHPYSKEEVPYPRCYDREVIDLEVWETAWVEQLCTSLTYHVFEEPPTKVLDIGCGAGTWLMNCARTWKDCHFVGLDIVPLHPDLQQVGWTDLAARISWVQANFLEGLPFPGEEFDYVRIHRIARGVPEDKWDSLLEEITRVMKSDGAFEIIEEDLFFPGKHPDSSSDSDFQLETYTMDSNAHADSRMSYSGLGLYRSESPTESTSPTDLPSPVQDRDQEWVMTSQVVSFNNNDDPPVAPLTRRPSLKRRTLQGKMSSPTTNSPPQTQLLRSSPSSAQSSQLELKTTSPSSHSNTHHFHLNSSSPSTHTSSSHFRGPASSAVFLLNALGGLTGPGGTTQSKSGTSRARAVTTPISTTSANHSTVTLTPIATTTTTSASSRTVKSTTSPTSPKSAGPFSLLRTKPQPPSNPRDHSLLETIYVEMHASRFINLSPLSILGSLLGLHFKNVRTHAPMMLTFPPLPSRHRRRHRNMEESSTSGEDPSGSESASDAEILPTSTPLRRSQSLKHEKDAAKDSKAQVHRHRRRHKDDIDTQLSTRGIINGISPYVLLDRNRMSAFSPSMASNSTTSLFLDLEQAPVVSNTKASSNIKNQLPNASTTFDLRTLNLHLALQATEVMACAEAMWEWVVEYQAQEKIKVAEAVTVGRRGRSGSVHASTDNRDKSQASFMSLSTNGMSHETKSTLTEMTRADFDGLLTQFDLDMKDHMALACVLEDRFHWPGVPTTVTAERKLFNAACDKWEHYERRRHHHPRNNNASPTSPQGRGKGTTRYHSKESNATTPTSHRDPARRICRSLRVYVGWKA